MADNLTVNDFNPAPDTMKIDDKVVKKMVGEAISEIDGILDAKEKLTDMLKSGDDLTRGLTVTVTEDNSVSVLAKIIIEKGKNIPDIVNQATDAITNALQNMAGLKVKDICVEVADMMTREEYEKTDVPTDYNYVPPMV